jgi:hypothetical protein
LLTVAVTRMPAAAASAAMSALKGRVAILSKVVRCPQ